jgi:hypothetical protein
MASTSGPTSLPLYVTPEKHGADLVSPVSEKASSNRSQYDGKELPILVHPIEWPSWIKHVVLLQMVAHAGMASWCASAFVRAYISLSCILQLNRHALDSRVSPDVYFLPPPNQ